MASVRFKLWRSATRLAILRWSSLPVWCQFMYPGGSRGRTGGKTPIDEVDERIQELNAPGFGVVDELWQSRKVRTPASGGAA
jgi:hypothetical protein